MESTTFYRYDVFISFRGLDTRDKFTSHLYERLTCVGVIVFKDDVEMVKGEGINEALKTAINSSRICMPIFSKNYASSKACLQELSHMVLECKSIIPIFYDVGVDDVKLKTNLYKKALKDHHQKGKVGKEEVEKWKMALIEVCKILGYNIVNKNEANEITKITREVLNRLMPKYQNVTNHFVEIDEQVESIIKGLDLNSSGCRIIGLCGMGGIGKTTLAKVVYNRISSNFNNCCTFIANVRESVQNNELPKLQQQLYKDLIDPRFASSIDDINHGINMIKKGLENKKFLLVLDDVDDKDLLTNFVGDHTQLANGSRIIITTRNKRVLKLLEQDLEVYEVQELDDDRAFQLFSRHAFRSDSLPEKFRRLSKKVVSSLGGLPLALEVAGSSLLGHGMKAWEETMERLKEAPDERIQGSLMISYRRLHKDEQNIFFDIACYPGRIEKTRACYMWASSGWHPNVSLDNLINQSLVKIEVFRGVEWLWMHDVLKDFGRDTIINECEENGRTFKRFLRVDEKFDKISNEERKCVEMLQILTTHVETMSSRDLEGFENVRFIELERFLIEGNFEGLFPNLRWISIRNVQHFTAINFHPENLAVLQLFSPYLEILDIQIKGNKLKVLDFSYCEYMKQTPSFKELSSLEILVLDWCTGLIEIDSSIRGMKKLIRLSMRECWSLQALPEVIGDAKALEEIILVGNYQRFKLPCSISNLENLSRLELIKINMEELPASIGKLVSLSQLDLSYTHIIELPDAIGQLKELRELRINHSKIRKFPTTIGRLTKLENLEAKGCENFVGDIPCEISMLPCLRILDLRETPISRISRLPSSLRILLINSKMKPLEIHTSNLLELVNLIELELCWKNLRFVPHVLVETNGLDFQWIWKASMLEKLHFHIPYAIIGSEIVGLSWLKKLDLSFVQFNGHLQLPSTITLLKLQDCKFWCRILDISHVKKLKELEILGCTDSLLEIRGLEELNFLMRLTLWVSNWWKGIFDVSKLKCLSTLELIGCRNLWSIVGFDRHEYLKEIHVRNLKSLRSLNLWNCKNLKSVVGFDGLEHLIDLSIRGCSSIEDFSFLYNLRILTSLELWNCRNLKRIKWFKGLESLTHLSIRDCPSLEGFPFLSVSMRNLSSFVLMDCKNLKGTLRFFELVSLHALTLENLGIDSLELIACGNLERIEGLNGLESLTDLFICNCEILMSLPYLSKLGNLKRLTLCKCSMLVTIGDLTQLKSLEGVHISLCFKLLLHPNNLSKLNNTRSVCIEDVQSSWANLSRLERLKHLRTNALLSSYRDTGPSNYKEPQPPREI